MLERFCITHCRVRSDELYMVRRHMGEIKF